MSNWLDEFKKEQMKDPEFKREYEKLDGEFEIRKHLVKERLKLGKAQQEISEMMREEA